MNRGIGNIYDRLMHLGANKWFLLILVVVAFILLGSNIGGLSIYAYDEAKNAGCAREMLQRSDWVVPTFNGELRTDKPPLHYFFMMAGYRLFGVNPFGARFFSAVAGVLTLLITFLYARRFLGPSTAVLAVFMLLASLQYGIQFHLSVPDPYLILWLSLAFFGFYAFVQHRQSADLWLCYSGVALGALTKGPVALVLPGLTALVYLVTTRQFAWPLIRALKPWWGLVLILVINLPWYLAVHEATGGAWTRGFFLEHNVGRYTSTMEGHGGFFLLPPLFIITALLPFSVFVVQAMRTSLRERPRGLIYYSMIVVLVVAGFFSVSQTKLLNYISPAMPFMALLLAGALAGRSGEVGRWEKFCGWIYLAIALLIPVALYIAFVQEEGLAHLRAWSALAAPIPAAALWSQWRLMRGDLKSWIFLNGTAFMLFSLLFFYGVYPKVDRTNAVLGGLEALAPAQDVVAFGTINPAFVFYLRSPVVTFHQADSLAQYLANRSSEEVHVITTARYAESVEGLGAPELLFRGKDLFESPVNHVYRFRRRATSSPD
jgi:4-amino-4-deoxy-L-arabinose transferase-like glycosyltransferase